VSDIEAGQVGLRCRGGDAGQFAVRGVGQTVDAAEAAAAGDFGVEVQGGVLIDAKAEEERGG
jgi:hypothetical protein